MSEAAVSTVKKENQTPVQKYMGRKYSFPNMDPYRLYMTLVYAKTGPVAPRMHKGWPEKKAHTMPAMADDMIISTTPKELYVPSWNNRPKAIAGERQAKNRKRIDAEVFTDASPLNASVQSLP